MNTLDARCGRRTLPAACWFRILFFLAAAFFSLPASRGQQAPPAPTQEIPIEWCDHLPVIRVQNGSVSLRFLVDTAATSILNVKSFSGGRKKEIQVSSWKGTAATSAVEVSLDGLQVGDLRLGSLKLPAIDLSPIAKACGGSIDGILGIDLMNAVGLTLNLKRQVAELDAPLATPEQRAALMETAMHHCGEAFHHGDAAVLESCLDPEIVLYTPMGEFRGRRQVIEYLRERYLRFVPNVRYVQKLKEVRIFGDALWYSYDYTLETPRERMSGHGMAMCRRSGGRWLLLNMHNSLILPENESKP